ncbi:hypothetical protein HBH98_148020 [Parastagonospora nodorum]|nr:hypothetical protein HBH53_165330 [Parastagonospora nodorum]KAH3990027.1 hypothetical protein HBH52_000330 [Parastagonospora nodorum]KAH4006846.1 hypothetical protein HBI10_011320 [Parastagonospora nodorum]KAH4011575.1 hypothetical protein HBI13_199260 [Parastagonospora nodorum]KAH4034505.1 hypothetical protein HBI09_099730 [Parastagonospora nodorum]
MPSPLSRTTGSSMRLSRCQAARMQVDAGLETWMKDCDWFVRLSELGRRRSFGDVVRKGDAAGRWMEADTHVGLEVRFLEDTTEGGHINTLLLVEKSLGHYFFDICTQVREQASVPWARRNIVILCIHTTQHSHHATSQLPSLCCITSSHTILLSAPA